jgi:hypothetical protein
MGQEESTPREPFETKQECLKGMDKEFKSVVGLVEDGKIGAQIIGKVARGPSNRPHLMAKNEKGITFNWTWECWPAGTTPGRQR